MAGGKTPTVEAVTMVSGTGTSTGTSTRVETTTTASTKTTRPAAVRALSWQLIRNTSVSAFHYRVTGLAGEAAFFALLSLPPLVLGLVGTLGHFRPALGEGTVGDIRIWLIERSQTILTGSVVDAVVVPLVDDMLRGGRFDIVSISFLVSLWAGSRALFVYIETISIAYGLADVRGIIRTRVHAFALYLVGLIIGLVVIPLMVAGPTLVTQALPATGGMVRILYWPVMITLSILFLALLYHGSVPVRTAWWREVPGAAVALLMWILGSLVLRVWLDASLSGVSIYGSLAAPVAVLAWLYVTALAVLIGATLNAEIDRMWPSEDTARARASREEARAAQQALQERQNQRHNDDPAGNL
jgi:membrane protein